MIIAIDGPSGTGKSTVSREVARRLGLPHLDTGAYYRAATLAALEAGVDPEDAAGVLRVVELLQMDQVGSRMLLGGRDVSAEIRSEAVNRAVSAVSAHPEVRRVLVAHQRDWVDSHHGRGVIEGRDIGSVVFPDADLKIYLEASPQVRAQRRAREMGEDPARVAGDLARRDHLDSSREASPLTIPSDAEVIDTTDLNFAGVVERVLKEVASRSGNSGPPPTIDRR